MAANTEKIKKREYLTAANINGFTVCIFSHDTLSE